MKYFLLSDLENAEELDDGLYAARSRVTEDSNDSEATLEIFSEGDLYRIRKRAPAEADGIAFTDDWMFFNSEETLFFNYVFRD